jgi:hypothetical protein
VSSAAAPDLSSFGLEPPISPTQVGGVRPPRPVAPQAWPPPAAPTPQPEPIAQAEQPVPLPDVTAAAVVQVPLVVRLSNGELIPVGIFPSHETAKTKARQMTRELEESRVWPFLAGRFIRPDAIVSIDID